MTDHLDLDVIAALGEGLLDPPEAQQFRFHLRNCPACAAREAAIAQVPAALRSLAEAEPPPLPATVAQRLDAALAAEAARAGTAPAGSAPAGSAPAGAPPDRVPSIADAPRRRHRGRAGLARPLAAAAAICLLGGAGYGFSRLAIHPATSGSAAPRTRAVATTPPNRGGPLLEPRLSGGTPPQVTHSGTDYQPGDIPAQVESVLRQAAARSAHTPAGSGPVSTPLPVAMQGCVRRIAGGRQPALVDEASYRGRPANVIVVPWPTGPGGQVWVTGTGCSAERADVLAHASISTIP